MEAGGGPADILDHLFQHRLQRLRILQETAHAMPAFRFRAGI